MRHIAITAALLLLTLVILASCSKDDPTGTAEDNLIGIWIWQSASRGGISIAVPADTLIYQGDFTGHYGAVANLDSYDFEYWIKHDTLFSFHTTGQTVGLTDSIKYQVDLEELRRYVRIHPDTVETQEWDLR